MCVWLRDQFLTNSGLQSTGYVDWAKFASAFNLLSAYDLPGSATKKAIKIFLTHDIRGCDDHRINLLFSVIDSKRDDLIDYDEIY